MPARELLDFDAALKHRVVFADMSSLPEVAPSWLGDERHFDKFDPAFGACSHGLPRSSTTTPRR